MTDEPAPVDSQRVCFNDIPNHYKELLGASKNELHACSVPILNNEVEKYCIDDIYLLDMIESVPVFCRVEYILILNFKWHICGQLLVPMFFSKHLHSLLYLLAIAMFSILVYINGARH